MNNLVKQTIRLMLFAYMPIVLGCQSGCQTTDSSPTLAFNNASVVKVDTVFPNTPIGNLAREHITLSMGSGEDAESKYQESLNKLRAQPEAGKTLYDAYKKLAPEYYMYRNMVVEALKELRSNTTLSFLNEIAKETIPPNSHPENAELDTRQDEAMIRMTAVEGISLLANEQNAEAHRSLRALIGNPNLSVRQMAARGYIQSPIGIAEEKMRELKQLLPKEEHWYITNQATDIKKVAHPEMPAKFDLPSKDSNNAPKIK